LLRPIVALCSLVLLALSACSPPTPPYAPDCAHYSRPDASAPSDARSDASVSHSFALQSASDFAALESARREVKFLLRADTGALPGPLAGNDCVFSQSERFPFHLQFLRSLPGLESYSTADYAMATERRATRTMAPGSLYWFAGATHPDGTLGVLAYTLSVSSDEAPDTVAAWAAFDQRLRQCVRWPASDLVLVGVDPAQEAWLLRERAALAAAGVTVAERASLSGAIEVYSPGETYGYVHTIAPGQPVADYGARDILVADAAHEEISIVSALITTFPQSFGSHLNLRMREKRLPNLRWSTARDAAQLRALEGALVHMVVTDRGEITLERATLDAATCFWRALQPPLSPPRSDLSVTALKPFAELSHSDAIAYGVKAGNLGEIYDALEAPFRSDGFAIPFATYAEHIRRNNLQGSIDALATDVGLRSDRAALAQRLAMVQTAIRRAPLAPGLRDAIAARIRGTWGASADTMFVRFRSSTNAEDLEQFSGAGLYDSRTGCLADDLDSDDVGPSRCLSATHRAALEARLADYRAQLAANPDRTYLAPLVADLEEDLTEEKTVADALRKVWRSLWNTRAFDEREFYGIDHRQVFMGVAVMPTMVLERRETVALTNLAHSGASAGLYRLVSQIGEIGVVRPEIPSAVAETMTFVREGSTPTMFSVSQRSSESPMMDLWSESERAQVAALLIRLHDHFATRVYPTISPLRLDVEIDVTSDGVPLFKQARPYLGG
jgi:pyruvate,water dikinase